MFLFRQRQVGAAVASQSRSSASNVQVHAATSPTVLITGGNTGIGYETALALAKKGYDVTIACKSQQRAAQAMNRIKEAVPSASIKSVQLDLADLDSVKACGSKLLEGSNAGAFDVLINNAGVMATPPMKTVQGYEFQLGVNHLGHFALLGMLLPAMQAANKPSRIINVASAAHMTGSVKFDDLMREKPGAYNSWEAYGQSKLANVMSTYYLARALRQSHPQISVNCLHPGVVRTELGRYMVNDANKYWMAPLVGLAFLFFKTPAQGAETSIHLAAVEPPSTTGQYFIDCKPAKSSQESYDQEKQRRLWEVSVELTGVDPLAGSVRQVASVGAQRSV